MSKHYKEFPLWLAIAAPVLLIAAICVFFISGQEPKAAATDQTAAGIAYLESLEKKDPAEVEKVRKEIYDRKIAAQRDQLVQQLVFR